MDNHLSLAALESYDPKPNRTGVNWRFLCPLCGDSKPKDAAHQSLSYNAQNGLWNCKRCHAKGKVTERWDNRPKSTRFNDREALLKTFQVSTPPAPIERPEMTPESTPDFDSLNLEYIVGSKGGDYLNSRGITPAYAYSVDVAYCPDFRGNEVVIFPVKNEAGERVAIAYRGISGSFKGNWGPRKLGVFSTPGADFRPDRKITIAESPIDALSLASCGVPAFALCGCDGLPDWFIRRCAFRDVQIAFDADDAGDNAADKITRLLSSRGVSVVRLRPPAPFKDWNEALNMQRMKLTEYLKPFSINPGKR